MQFAASAFGNLGRLATLERNLEMLPGNERQKEVSNFVETLPLDELKEVIPKASEEVLGILFTVCRDLVKDALFSLADPLQKGKKFYQLATTLPKIERKIAHDLLSESITLAREALRDDKADPKYMKEAHILLAQIFGAKGNISGAIKEVRKSLQISGDAVAHFEIAKLYKLRRKDGDLDHARESFRKALELTPDFQQATLELSRCYEEEDMDQAIKILLTLDNLPDTHPGIYNELGTLYKKKHEAVQDKLFKNGDEINLMRSQLGKISSFYEEFIDLLKELHDRYEYPNGLYHEKKPGEYLPVRRKKNEDRIIAIRSQLESMKTDPLFDEAPEGVRALIEKYEETIKIFQQMVERPESDRYYSIHYYRKAIHHTKPYTPSHLNLGRVYFRMGRLQIAMKHHRLAHEAGVNVAGYLLARLYMLDTDHKDLKRAKKLLESFISITEQKGDELSLRYLDEAKEELSKLSL